MTFNESHQSQESQESQVEAALHRIARSEAAALLAQVLEESRRDAAEILRARLTAALVEEVGRLSEGRDTAERAESVPPRPAETAAPRPAPRPAETAAPRPADSEPLSGWYVYGLTWDAVARGLDLPAGVDEAPVEVVAVGDIAAVVSPMASTLPWGIGSDGEVDLDQLAPRARRHEWVLEQMLERGAVLPLRFGVLYPSLEPLRQVLTDRAAAFGDALRHLENHYEWGLTISAEGAGAPRRLNAVPAADSGGRDYLARRRADRIAEEERSRDTAQVAAGIHEALLELSDDARIQPTARPTGGDGKVVLRASYLVSAASADAFQATAEQALSAAPPHLRLTGELTGPWPPYHFCDLALDGMTA
ncbi:MAG TPA: GvpL/GvpF family gas vesicle protein [Acidimicrobiales bacterium]|nr:GvpL/GvpF family gas vesicle protein [Acidimicrobiales bacterium]